MICRRCDLPKAAHTEGPLGLVCPKQVFTYAPQELKPDLGESAAFGAFVGGAVAGAALTFGARAAQAPKPKAPEESLPKGPTPRQKQLARNKQRSPR